jgi:isopenicillin N synthase-like dioxygenase
MSQFKDYTPPFPSNIAVAELETVSLKRLAGGDQEESAKLYASCRTLGFFLLDLRGQQEGDTLLESVDRLFSLSEELYEIPIEHKLQFALRPGTAYGLVSQEHC